MEFSSVIIHVGTHDPKFILHKFDSINLPVFVYNSEKVI